VTITWVTIPELLLPLTFAVETSFITTSPSASTVAPFLAGDAGFFLPGDFGAADFLAGDAGFFLPGDFGAADFLAGDAGFFLLDVFSSSLPPFSSSLPSATFARDF
jgi:hypothetical protein